MKEQSRNPIVIKYSIIVPVYNVEKYIVKCLDSIINQEGFNELCELILIDDGSTDSSGTICDNYAASYTNTKVIHKQNEGLLMARGTGVKESKGKYIINIDSDDYIEKDYLKIIDAYVSTYSPDFLNYGFIEDKDEIKNNKPIIDKDCVVIDKTHYLKLFIVSNKYNSVCLKVIKSEILKKQYDSIYNFKTNMGEDKIQTANILRYSNKICLVKDCLYHYVMRANSIVHNKSEKDLYDSIDVYERVGSVVKKILDSMKLKDNEKKEMLSLYDSYVLNDMMDHIYKYSRRKDINKNKKIRVLNDLSHADIFSTEDINQSQFKIYNKIRYKIFISKKFSLLIQIDKILYLLQIITKTAV